MPNYERAMNRVLERFKELEAELAKAKKKIRALEDDLSLLDGKLLARGERIAMLEKELKK